jgi:hypothetical protein
VTFTRLHALARRQRRRAALLAVMLFLGGAVVVAHSAAGEGHMGDGMAMCLAVITAGAAAIVGLTRAAAELLRAPSAVLLPVPVMPCVPRRGRPLPRSRAGPAVLQVFLR